MASTYGAVTVGTSATLILPANGYRKGCEIRNNFSNVTFYIGMDENVTASNGLPIVPGESFNTSGERTGWRGNIYGVVASGSADCRYWEWQV